MANVGKYCKAYPVGRLREFDEWKLNAENLRKEKTEIDGKEIEVPRQLTDNDFLYLQENHTVTDGIFVDENIIFSDVTDEWIDFCRMSLKFEPEARNSD